MTDLSPETVGKLVALEHAFAFVDCCAGEGTSATTEGHGLLWADILSESLCNAFGIELDEHWPANLSRALAAGDRS